MITLDVAFVVTERQLCGRLGSLAMVLLMITGFARIATGESLAAIGVTVTIAGLCGAIGTGRWEAGVIVLGLAAYAFCGYHLLHERRD